MGLLSNRVERAMIKPGDHIYTWRALYTYSHHGIYVGENRVVHFTPEKETSSSGDLMDSSNFSTGVPLICPYPDCGSEQPSSGVVLSCLDCFLGNGSLYCFEYGVPSTVFIAKVRGGTCTTAESDPSELVIYRTMHLLRNGFGNYDLFENNCEDFALYCKTGLLTLEELGRGRSGQAYSFVGIPLAALFSSPLKLLMAGSVGVATMTAGMYCAGRYVTDIGVRKDVVKVSVEDIAMRRGWQNPPEASIEDTAADGVCMGELINL